jgi:membrane protein
MDLRRVLSSNYNPTRWVALAARLVARSLARLWGRDVMLYVGGVSFFALLAAFPAVAILLGVLSLTLNPNRAAAHMNALVQLVPPGAQALVQSELLRLAKAPVRAMSAQSLAAALIGFYAALRGFKALIAGLSFIHDEQDERGFVHFNILALLALVSAFALIMLASGVFLAIRVLAATLHLYPFRGVAWFYSEWSWASAGLAFGLTLVYRYAMAKQSVDWRASAAGGVAAAALCLAASWASAFYVHEFAHFGATYGSVAAVVVLLIWLSWNINAIFFGGALTTEIELLIKR